MFARIKSYLKSIYAKCQLGARANYFAISEYGLTGEWRKEKPKEPDPVGYEAAYAPVRNKE